jgi:hypothetical protein
MSMDESAALAAKLEAEGRKLMEFMGGLAEAHWNMEIYTEGTMWTTRSIVAHLVSAERAFLKLFQQIRDGGDGVSADFEIDRWNASQQRRMQQLNTAQLLTQFLEARANTVEFVRGLVSDELAMQGRHPYLGATSLREMIKMIHIHGQTHYRDVRRALKSA